MERIFNEGFGKVLNKKRPLFVPLNDVTPFFFLHRIAELVSPPYLIHLGGVLAVATEASDIDQIGR